VRNDAFFRQGRRCGVCGLSLDDQQEFGHHVIPDQSGNAADTADRFLRTVDNCVMLCDSFTTLYTREVFTPWALFLPQNTIGTPTRGR
jgi:hypothetical protein